MRSERGFEAQAKIIEKAKEDVKVIRPILAEDPDWIIVSQKFKPFTQDEYRRQRRALTRLTKKAVNLLYPEYKVIARHDRGTAYNWVNVNIIISEKMEWDQLKAIRARAERMLESVGLQYASYLPDSLPGRDDWSPCLLVLVNGAA